MNTNVSIFADDLCDLACNGRNRMNTGEWQIAHPERNLYVYLTSGEAKAVSEAFAKLAETLAVLEAVEVAS